MTISVSYAPDTYAGDGSTDTFAITFEFLDTASNVKVSIKNSAGTITTKTSGTHYNVSGSNVVFTSGNIPSGTDTVIIELNPDYLQESDYTENSSLPAETLENDLDKLTLQAQLNKDLGTRSVRMDAAVDLDSFDATLPTPSADKYLKYNSDASGMEAFTLSTTAGLGNVVEDTSPQLGGNLDTLGFNLTSSTTEGTIFGRTISTDGTKLDTIETSADVTDEANVTSALSGATLTAATIATDDKVLIQDTSDTDNLKTVTVQNIMDQSVAAVPSAGDATEGLIEIAVQSEMEADSSTTLAVTPGRMKYAPGVCKAWVYFNGQSTVSIYDSYNVSSITDNSTGNYTVNFTNDMASASYAVAGSATNVGGSSQNTSGSPVSTLEWASNRTVSAVRVGVTRNAGDGNFDDYFDSAHVCVMVFAN